MRIKPDVGSVVGPSDTTHWGQAILTPFAYGIVELETTDARKDGIALLTELGDRLKEPPVSLDRLKKFTSELVHVGTKSIAILVPVGEIIYIVLSGQGAIYLKRGDTISCLLDTPGALSGEVREGDTIILASRSLTQAISKEAIVGAFDHSGAQDVAEKLTLILHEAGSPLGSTALIFQVVQFVGVEQEVHIATPITGEAPRVSSWTLSEHVFSALKPIQSLFHPHIRRRITSLRSHFHMKSHHVPFFALTIIILFLLSVAIGISRKHQAATNKHVSDTLIMAQHDFDEGVALIGLNPIKGRERLTEAKNLLEPLTKTLSTKSGQGRDVGALYQKVVDNLSVAMHIVREDPAIFFDPSLVRKEGIATSIGLFNDTLGVLDSTNNSVYTVTISGKSSAIVGGGSSIVGATKIAVYGTKLFILTPNGISSVDTTSQQTTSGIINPSNQWGTIGAMVGYTGNLYLLDTQKNRIWKYISTDTGFSDIHEYLNPDTLPDFSHATGLAIDGSVWVGTSDGTILRFTQGAVNTFTAQGVEPQLAKYLLVYTDSSVKNVYVLDRDNKRVVVLDKDGMYLGQYVWQKNFQPTQMVVSEAQKEILFLAGGKIYAIGIQ